ncbi:galactose mutarotase-like [Culicoides brevitarsis]|uniref:galactose mutarotase-like n=1 Tax=Culicoides brevitarsis TaxID=469753 RepID=UPI00307C5BD9
MSSDSGKQLGQNSMSRTEVEFAVRKNDILLQCSNFGFVEQSKNGDSSIVKKYKWINKNNMQAEVITYGATITKILVPDKNGKLADIVLGFDDIQEYENNKNPNIGCTIGRVTNRISNGKFVIGEREIVLETNADGHHLHSEASGFSKRNWKATNEGTMVIMSLLSLDGDGGYPGDVLSHVTFYLDNDNNFHIKMQAVVSEETPINMTNHSYFNLGGHESGQDSLYEHFLTINADKITVNDCDTIPTGKFQSVTGSKFDFRVSRNIGKSISHTYFGFDDNFCITKGTDQKLCFMARAIHPNSGRYLEVYSDQPGLQFYTANSLPDQVKSNATEVNNFSYKTDSITHLDPVPIEMTSVLTEELICTHQKEFNKEEPLKGKGGALYTKHGAFCLEPQKYPDAVNRPEFPSIIVKPESLYSHNIIFKFGVV